MIGGMNVILQQRFRDAVTSKMHDLDLSQSDLARRMRVTPQYVSKCLRGEQSPGLDVIERFASSLGLDDPADLLAERILQPMS